MNQRKDENERRYFFQDQFPRKYGTELGSNSRFLDLQPDSLLTVLGGGIYMYSGNRTCNNLKSMPVYEKLMMNQCYTNDLLHPMYSGHLPLQLLLSSNITWMLRNGQTGARL